MNTNKDCKTISLHRIGKRKSKLRCKHRMTIDESGWCQMELDLPPPLKCITSRNSKSSLSPLSRQGEPLFQTILYTDKELTT